MVTSGARFTNFLKFKYISSDILKVFFLCCLNAYCLTPSITNSLRITSLDDGPIQPALAYKYPEYFETDANAVRYLLLMWTSSTKWFPAVAFKYLSIDPVFFSRNFHIHANNFVVNWVFYVISGFNSITSNIIC